MKKKRWRWCKRSVRFCRGEGRGGKGEEVKGEEEEEEK